MNETITRFLVLHFFEIFFLILAWNVAVSAWLLWRRSRRGLKLPKPGDPDVVFVERFASGNSHKTFLTRLAGASRCLTVIVTGSELAITTFFPFTVFAGFYDLEHVIPRNRIIRIEERGAIVDIEFFDPAGSSAKFTLRLGRTGEFLRALRTRPEAAPFSALHA